MMQPTSKDRDVRENPMRGMDQAIEKLQALLAGMIQRQQWGRVNVTVDMEGGKIRLIRGTAEETVKIDH